MHEFESTTEPHDMTFSAQFLDAAPDAIVVIDAGGMIRVANQQALELFGYGSQDLIGRSIDTLVPARRRDGHAEKRATYREAPQIRPMGDPRSQVKAQRADGTLVPVEIALSPVAVDGLQFVMAIVRDTSDRTRIEREQAIMRQRLAVVEDRDRIARDLHDLVIQRLFATGMRLQAALNDPARLAERAGDAVTELDETISVIRHSIFHLTHTEADLSTRVRELIDRHDASVQCAVAIEIDENIDQLPPKVAEHLLPTLNEALANVVRHSRATSVSVSLELGTTLELRVIDDGVGIDPEATPGFGLSNLRKRAAALGGTMTIGPIADGGTDLIWQIPVSTDELESAPS
jgi:PAS domain S-box-containing protein